MSKLAEQLNALKIHNNWDMLVRFGDANCVAVQYHAPASGRAGYADYQKSYVWSPRPHPKLNEPRSLSRTYAKEFIGDRKQTWLKALEWATKEFGHEFVPSPFGGRLPKKVIEAAKAAVKS